MSDGAIDQAVITFARLAPREREYLLFFLEGVDAKEIAWRMGLSESGASNTKRRILDKLAIQTDLQLILFGIRSGLLDIDGTLRHKVLSIDELPNTVSD